MTIRRSFFLLVLLVYLIGPNPKAGGVQLGDFVLLTFAIGFVAVTRLRVNARLLAFFAWPALAVAVAFFGRTLRGVPLDSDELNNVFKTASLGVLGMLGVWISRAGGEDEKALLVRRMMQLVVIAIVFTSLVGLLEYVRPGAFSSLVSGVYEMQLRNNLTNVEQAEQAGRITSIFSWANTFGEFLLYGLTVLTVNRRSVGRLWLAAAVLLGVPCLVLTNSRLALLFFCAMLLYVTLIDRRWGLLAISGTTAVAVVLLVPVEHLIGAQNSARLTELLDFVRYGVLPPNVEVRLSTLAFLSRKLLTSEYFYFGFPMPVYESTVFLSWDNQYLGFFVKYGITGVLLVIWQLASILVPLLLLRRTADHRRRLYLHTLILLNVMVLVGGLSQDTLFVERWKEFYFALTGVFLGVGIGRPAASHPSTSETERLSPQWSNG